MSKIALPKNYQNWTFTMLCKDFAQELYQSISNSLIDKPRVARLCMCVCGVFVL